MIKSILIAAVALVAFVPMAEAKDHVKHAKHKPASTVVASITPDCTGTNSPAEVISGTCNLVKGRFIYGDIAGLSSLTEGLSGIAGSIGSGIGGTF